MIRMGDRLKQNQLFALALYITVTKLHVNSRRVIRLRLKQNQLFALALYITVTKLHVNSRRVIRLFFCFFYYSGKRPSYMILSSP